MSEHLATLKRPKAYESETQNKLNNDPLAHVYLLLQGLSDARIEERIWLEFTTDMGERLESQPFCSSYHYTYDGEEIIYDTGISYLESLKNSCIAAQHDVVSGTFSKYHLDRQIAFYEQGQIIKNWLDDTSNKHHLLLLSLCPTVAELSTAEAKKQSFKPDRQMASIQLHTKNSDGSATTIAFSLDGLTPERLQLLFDNLGFDALAASDTMAQLTQPIYINESYEPAEAVANIINGYDQLLNRATGNMHKQGIDTSRNIVEANSFVRNNPEAYELYRNIINEVALSLQSRRVEPGLQSLVYRQLVVPYGVKKANIPDQIKLSVGDYFDKKKAASLIDYLRTKAIPEYLTQKLEMGEVKQVGPSTAYRSSDGDGFSIGSAGVNAQAAGKSYDGGCPSSSGQASGQSGSSLNSSEQARQLGLSNNTVVKYSYKKGFCVVPNCPSLKLDRKVLVGPCSVCKDCQENGVPTPV